MGMRIAIDLDDVDLKHFRLIMHQARNTAIRLQPDYIAQHADQLLRKVDREKTPNFIATRLEKLKIMIDMLTDHEWRLPQKDAAARSPAATRKSDFSEYVRSLSA